MSRQVKLIMDSKKPTISVIITTYNSPNYLTLILSAFNEQDTDGFEVVVADDGSTSETKEVIDSLRSKLSYDIKYVWQPDDGFRAAMIRNKSVAVAGGEYLIFLDGDLVPRKSFIRRHHEFAEDGYFVAGNRIMLPPKFAAKILSKQLPIHRWSIWKWFYLFCQRKIGRFQPLIYLGGKKAFWRYLRKKSWKVRFCMGVWKKDFFKVNGLDESFSGWGYEDSDFIIRLIRSGVLHKDGRYALPVFHLWHPMNKRDREPINSKKLEDVLESSHVRAEKGVDQYV